jgi:hypothetical protein
MSWHDLADRLDLSEREVTQWKDAGFTADDAYAWGDGGGCGFSAGQAQEWKRVGFQDPYVADSWSAYGFDPQEARRWYDAGFTNFEDDYPALWRDTKFSDPSDAQEWREAGFNHAQALSWREASISCEAAKEFFSNTGSNLRHVPEMYFTHDQKYLAELNAGIGSPYGIYGSKDWQRLGFSPEAAAAWQSSGWGPERAAELRHRLMKDSVKATAHDVEFADEDSRMTDDEAYAISRVERDEAYAMERVAYDERRQSERRERKTAAKKQYLESEKAHANSVIEHDMRAALDRRVQPHHRQRD